MDKDIKLEDFKQSIREKNLINRQSIIEAVKKKYGDIKINERNGVPKMGKYMYDYVWIDGEYQNMSFRICLYYQDIDLGSLNVHIFHGPYTFQKKLLINSRTPTSIFDGKLNCEESFNRAMKNIKHSTYDADNFKLEGFIDELLNFLKYKKND